MQDKTYNLPDRFLDYAVEIIFLTDKIRITSAGRHVASQLLRSGTSAGSNYEEGCGAESRADFIHKLQLSLKELRESLFWIKVTKRAKLHRDYEIDKILNETQELANIIAQSLITAKRGRK